MFMEFGRLKQIVFLFIFAVLGSFLGACTPIVESHGNQLEPEDLSLITEGETSEGQVRQILGSPTSISSFDDDIWYYSSEVTNTRAFLAPELKERKIVAIRFDEEGYVAEISNLNEEDAIEIVPNRRETETRGRRYTFLEQLIGNVSLGP